MTNDKPNVYSDIGGSLKPLATPATALAIGAHPDDIEFGAGGTLAKWAEAGCRVTMLVVTDGSKGTWDPSIDPADLVRTRAQEQHAAAAALGATEVRHLEMVDGELEYTMELRKEMCRQIRDVKPDVVLSHDPWQRYQLHPDHRATGWAVMDGVISARDHLFFPEQDLEEHRPGSVLLWSADAPDHWEDIAAQFDSKIAALLCHSSQGTTTMGGAEQTESNRTTFVSKMEKWAANLGTPAGLTRAESFKRIKP
ncbi:MAG: PIG-L deacetylase family protein [Acidimicrobiia bacterium]|nr:PIG-L deacetylase family protein [Acidimicrobiia bacterium]MDX2466673.1 PIG-L deacetylase family protein [Acidimicrobiia bacterium]